MYNSTALKASEADQVGDANPTLTVATNDQTVVDRKVKILNLRNFQSIQRACEDALTNKKFVGIAGDPGLGKSTALRYFEKQNKNVFVVTVTASMTVRDFWVSVFETIHNKRVDNYNRANHNIDELSNDQYTEYRIIEDIAQESGVQLINIRNNPNIHFIIKQIVKNINSTGGLLALDEAGKFRTTRFLEMIHELRDATMDNAGLIIAGPEYFKRQLQTWVNKNVTGIPELWSRISYWKALDIPGRDDIKEFCHAYDVNDLEVIKEFQSIRNYRLLYNRVIHYLEERAEEALYQQSQNQNK